MPKIRTNKKGVALFMVLGTLLVVIILANIILNFILSQSRFTHHQVSRIQAYYAAQAGMVYALEQLRTGAWRFPVNCSNPAGCPVSDTDFPPVIKEVKVIFCPPTQICAAKSTPCIPPLGCNFCIDTLVNYTYNP